MILIDWNSNINTGLILRQRFYFLTSAGRKKNSNGSIVQFAFIRNFGEKSEVEKKKNRGLLIRSLTKLLTVKLVG